jgi:hypothetical protein
VHVDIAVLFSLGVVSFRLEKGLEEMISKRVAVAALTAIAALGPAHAAVTISTAATQDMTCSGGVCSPTFKDATLNVADLENLLAIGNVTVTTTGTGKYSHVEAGKISTKASFGWSNAASLSLNAHNTIEFDQPVSVTGSGAVSLKLKRTLSFGGKGSLSFANVSSAFTINGYSYTLASDIASLATAIAVNSGGNFALANDYDASGDGTYSASPIVTYFQGNFDGLGHTISNLSVRQKSDGANYVGFFAQNIGLIKSLKLAHVDVGTNDDKSYGTAIGGLVGYNDGGVVDVSVSGSVKAKWLSAGGIVGYQEEYGEIMNSSANVRVSSPGTAFPRGYQRKFMSPSHVPMQPGIAGGLVAINGGVVMESHADGNVSAAMLAGGIVGQGGGEIVRSYSTGNVTGGDSAKVGGVVGEDDSYGSYESYATGAVTGGADSEVGGFVGEGNYLDHTKQSYSIGAVSGWTGSLVGGFAGVASGFQDCYWDTDTSGTSDGIGGGNTDGITGLTTEQLQSGLPPGFELGTWDKTPESTAAFLIWSQTRRRNERTRYGRAAVGFVLTTANHQFPLLSVPAHRGRAAAVITASASVGRFRIAVAGFHFFHWLFVRG